MPPMLSIICFMVADDGWTLPRETPTWDGPYFGVLGVLTEAPDGDTVQCHVCGDWFALLGTHANASHGLGADAYRRSFGLAGTIPVHRSSGRDHFFVSELVDWLRTSPMHKHV